MILNGQLAVLYRVLTTFDCAAFERLHVLYHALDCVHHKCNISCSL